METECSALDSPTIQTSNISSTFAVQSDQGAILGGLIRDETQDGSGGILLLCDLRGIGPLFGEATNSNRRTELAALTPRVIASEQDAKRFTEDFRSKMKGLEGSF